MTHPAVPLVAEPGLIRDVRVGRQAIYDADRRLVAYQAQFLPCPPLGGVAESLGGSPLGGASGGGERLGGGLDERAASRLISATFTTFGPEVLAGGRPVFLGLTRPFLTGVLPVPISPENVIVEVSESLVVDHELLLGLDELRNEGYRIAVDDYRGDVSRAALLEVADFVAVDLASLPTLTVAGLVESCRYAGVTLLGTHVADADTLARCLDLGFELFQGPYLQQPGELRARSLTPTQVVCVRLLNELADPEAPIGRVADLVAGDPGLALRLLRTANSSAVGSTRLVESVREALTLIGPKRVRAWVILFLLEGGACADAGDELWKVLARAHAVAALSGVDTELGFTVGLLSGAADLLGSTLEAVAEAAGVGPHCRAALLEEEGPAGLALTAVLAHEHNDVDAVLAAHHDPAEVSAAHVAALSAALDRVREIFG